MIRLSACLTLALSLPGCIGTAVGVATDVVAGTASVATDVVVGTVDVATDVIDVVVPGDWDDDD